MIDYILIRKSKRKLIRDVKVVRQKQCIPNHKLIICVLDLEEGLNKRKIEFVKKFKVWKLRDDVTAGIFKERVQARAALMVEKPAGVEEAWKNFKECLIEEAIEVWGNAGDEKAQGVLVVERRDCSLVRGEARFIQVVEGASEVQKRVQMWEDRQTQHL